MSKYILSEQNIGNAGDTVISSVRVRSVAAYYEHTISSRCVCSATHVFRGHVSSDPEGDLEDEATIRVITFYQLESMNCKFSKLA